MNGQGELEANREERSQTATFQDLKEAIEKAIEAEKLSRSRYLELARNAVYPEVRIFFEQLAQEEEGHQQRLVEKLKALRLLYDE